MYVLCGFLELIVIYKLHHWMSDIRTHISDSVDSLIFVMIQFVLCICRRIPYQMNQRK